MPERVKLDRFFGIESGERRSVALMLAHSFCMGLATVFFETAASAMFLARYPSSFLLWVYIAAAGANIIASAASHDIVRGVLHVLCERLRRISADASTA